MVDKVEIVVIETDRLFEFIDGLQASGYKIDPRQISVLNQLLITLIARGETLEDLPLKTLIAPLICTTPLEQEDFYQQFERWYATLLPVKQSNTKERFPPLPPIREATAKEKFLPTENSRTATQKKAYIVREETKQETVSKKVRVKGYLQEVFPIKQIKPIVSALRKRTQILSSEVDVEGTIQRAIKRNNWLEVVFHQRQIQPEYVVLIDRKNRLDQQARFAQEVLAKIAEDGVWLHQYEFKNDPRICFPLDRKHSPLQLKDLQARHPDSRLLIFSGTSEFTNPLTGHLPVWVENLEHWKERAILFPDNLEKVFFEELELQDFALLPLTFDGLASVVRVFETENVPLTFSASNLPSPLNERPTRWTGRNAPPETEVKMLIDDLKNNYLDEKGFYWLCATAVFPELRWEITLYLGSVLKDDTDQELLDVNRLLQIARLPWFRIGYMPDWLRSKLVDLFSEKQESQVRKALFDLLSEFYKGKEFEIIFSQKSKIKLKNNIRKFLDTQKQTSPIEGPLQDQLFVNFIIERNKKKLSVTAPENIQNAVTLAVKKATPKNNLVLVSPSMLIGRQEQLNQFATILDRIARQAPTNANLFEWYGIHGMGKSSLVNYLSHMAAEKQCIWASINFKNSANKLEEYLNNPVRLVQEVVLDLNKRAELDTREFEKALTGYKAASLPKEGVISAYTKMDQGTRLYQQPSWLNELRNVVFAFIKMVNTLPHSNNVRPVVLFFDETEYAEFDLVDWIEELIIAPLIQIKHCVIVWTGRRPWHWKRPEVRQRLTSENLRVFEPDLVKEQIQSLSKRPDLTKELYKNIYSLTGGHPIATYIVINELDILIDQGKNVTPQTFSGFESKLLADVFHKFIEDYVFRELKSKDLKIACKFMALVRSFDVTMMREVLRSCAGETFKSWTREDFSDLLLNIKKTQLLTWENGHAIDPSLRHIIQKYFMTFERKNFIAANKAALRMYEDWLEKPVDNRTLFIIEELYHNASLLQVGERIDLGAILNNRLENFPNWIKDEKQLDNALEHLDGKISNDRELNQLLPSTFDFEKQVLEFRSTRRSDIKVNAPVISDNSSPQISRKTQLYICVLTSTPDEDDIPYDPSPYMSGYRWKHHNVESKEVEKQIRQLMDEGVDVFINLCDGTPDDALSGIALVKALEKYNAAFTGADSKFFDPTRDEMKNAAKRVSVPTPGWFFARRAEDVEEIIKRLKFPMLVKPPHGYASVGIRRQSRVETIDELREQLMIEISEFGRALIEEFIEGREFTCLIAENPNNPKKPYTYTPIEFIFPDGESFKHYDMKWVDYEKMSVAVVSDPRIEKTIREQTAHVFNELGGNGYARCDYRMGIDGLLYFLDINPNCGIFYPPHEPGSADFSLLNDPTMDHAKFMKLIIRNAQRRQTRIAAERIIKRQRK